MKIYAYFTVTLQKNMQISLWKGIILVDLPVYIEEIC